MRKEKGKEIKSLERRKKERKNVRKPPRVNIIYIK